MRLTKQVQAKGWFLTYPKCDVPPQVALEYLREKHQIIEYVIAQEKHQDGTDHLHAFIKTEKKITFGKTTFDFPEHHGNYQVAKSWKAVQKYVVKGGNYITNIDLDSAQAKKGKRNMQLVSMDPKEALAQGFIGVLQLKQLVVNQQLFRALQQPYAHSTVRGRWYWGPPGVGKSTKARSEFPDAYIKAQNKWWDGYTGQKAVILDDFDKGGICLGHYLKIWADSHSCSGETKGAVVNLQHEVLIITSNYPPESLFSEDVEMLAAILRRFTVLHFETKQF